MKWPDNFDQNIDLKKVSLEVINSWIEKRIEELLGMEDEVVSGYA